MLAAHAAALGRDHAAYRNHAYRVANLCLALAPAGGDRLEKIAVAAAFHDLGIWTDATFDYLPPSIRLAAAHLAASGQRGWSAEIERMILDHHKLTVSRAEQSWLVEAFRKADWIDVSRGALRFGLPRPHVRRILAAWPNAGFHRRLVHLSLQRVRSHPLSPLPMFRI